MARACSTASASRSRSGIRRSRRSSARSSTSPSDPPFVRGLELARGFYADAVRPLLGDTPHSAALLGWGSDVLGFDTARSSDHGWGPRLQVFVDQADAARVSDDLDTGLPDAYGGWPTRFGWDDVPVSHHVVVAELGSWLEGQLGFDPRRGISPRDWLTTPQQLLLEVTAGAIFHDGLGQLAPARDLLRWYPDEVWLWLLACQWRRLDQEEPFVGRAAEAGDELGSRVIAARLARDLMRLCFLFERRYAPYSKWLGSAFRNLDAYTEIGPPLLAALVAADQAARQTALVEAFEKAAERHNRLGITTELDAHARPFYTRPYRVLGSGRFVDACLERVTDRWLRSLPLIGGVDQLADSTDVLSSPRRARRTAALYEPD